MTVRRRPVAAAGTRRRAAVGLVGVVTVCLATAGCASDADGGTAAANTGEAAAELDVVASFYPLQFVAERVGGTLVEVSNLTPAGAEPHDLELSARDAAALQDADLVVQLSGFMPAIDDAIDTVDATAIDVAPVAGLEQSADDTDDGDTGAGDTGADPHFWLDPTRLADVGDALAERFGELAPDEADTFAANAAALRSDLETLDAEFRTGLASCASTDLVTSHEAFGYLAARYGLAQVGITGLSPDEEPSPARLAEVTDFVDANRVRTIYFETLVDPAIAETIATETGATTAVLDPLEGLAEDANAADYLSVMRTNLDTLRTGQECA